MSELVLFDRCNLINSALVATTFKRGIKEYVNELQRKAGADDTLAEAEQIPGSRIAPAYHYYQQAACAALLAEEKLLHGEGIPSDALAPFYLRLPQAERELRKKQNNE